MTKAKAIAKNNPVDTATMEKFLAAKTHVGYKHNAAGAKIWYELDLAQIGDTKISKATAAELLKNGFGLTIDEYLAAQEQWITQELARVAAQIAQDDRNEILSTPRVRQEAMEVAVNAELKKVLAKEGRLVQTVIEETDGSEDDADEETFAAVIPTEDNDYDETDEPEILNADLFVNLYHSPMQERYASVTRSINGEQLHFFYHRLTHISAPALDLEVYFDNGRMNFWHGSKRIARDKVWQVPIIKETAKAQTESFGKFFAGDHTSKFFKVSVYPTFADGSEHNYVRYFDFFNQAQKFVEEVKTFVSDVPTQIYITSGGQYLYTRINGTEHYTLPAVDVTEAQSRLDELNKAIADNESFADKCDDDLTASKLRIANCRNKRSIAYYEAASRMTEPIIKQPEEKSPTFELARLKAQADAAKVAEQKAADALDEAQKIYDKARNATCEANSAINRLYRVKANELKNELFALPKVKIELKTTCGEKFIASHTWGISTLGISTLGNKFSLLDMTAGACLATYDTPEQVTDVIERLKAAIRRGDNQFSFAHEDEPINQPDNSTPDKLRDSLARGMKECLIKTQEHLRANDISAALVENERYQICANALHDVKEMIA